MNLLYIALACGAFAVLYGIITSRQVLGMSAGNQRMIEVSAAIQEGAGAYLNRQGYYSAVLETAKAKMEAYEWAYWMEGKAAAQDIKSPNGDLLAKAGSTRDGGSYEQRMGGIACWNAIMDENTYMVQKWNEFVAA